MGKNTNKEKARELAKKHMPFCGVPITECIDTALEMAEWKEDQLIRAAKNAFCEMCPHGPCPYPIDNGEECKRRFAFGEKIYNSLQ